MDDLQAVAFMKMSLGPAVARDDFAIEFDGDAVGFHSKDLHEGGEGERNGRLGECTFVAVDVKFHFDAFVVILSRSLLENASNVVRFFC
jgi:hypothetical protein